MHHTKKFVASLMSLAILLFGTDLVVGHAQNPIKVAILPVQIHAPENMDYLQGGFMAMLESRIGGKEDIDLLDRNLVTKTFDKFKKDLNETTARSLAQDLGADYLVAGSVTSFGTGGSIDFEVFAKDPSTAPFTTYKVIKDMNNLLPEFSQLADEISAKGFAGRPHPVSATPEVPAPQPEAEMVAPPPTPKAAPQQQQAQPQPSAAATSAEPGTAQPKMASIKQELVEETPPSTEIQQQAASGITLSPQMEPWKSQELDNTFWSIDVGDVFGDGSKELVAMSRQKICVYRYKPEGLEQLTIYSGAKDDRFIWVSVADLNRNGRDEIFVTSQKKISSTKRKLASLVVEWDGSQLVTLARDVDYYLRTVRVPGLPARLLGQKGADDGTFQPQIYNLAWVNNGLAPVNSPYHSKSANIFNAARGDITGQGETETLEITPKEFLFLLAGNGQPIWRSYDYFGSTENYIDIELANAPFPEPVDHDGDRFSFILGEDSNVKKLYISSPILLTDLNNDGKLEIVLTRNLPSLAQLGGSRRYSKNKILSLTWGGNGMLENWETGEIEGMVTSLQISDLNGDGNQELIVCTNHSPGVTDFWKGDRSVILSYGLR
jgi:FG-GAP-like repeat